VGFLNAFRWRHFLTETEREQIAAALDEAGRHTRAKIGLSIEAQARGDPHARARTHFREWRLPEAERPTAVLVYVCAATRQYAIVGGEEVHRVAPPTFWELVDRDLSHHFEEGRYCDGIFKAIAQVAVQLERLFPLQPRDDADAPPSVDQEPFGEIDSARGGTAEGLAGGKERG
jgi:uncharacterized membrane protein YgcG